MQGGESAEPTKLSFPSIAPVSTSFPLPAAYPIVASPLASPSPLLSIPGVVQRQDQTIVGLSNAELLAQPMRFGHTVAQPQPQATIGSGIQQLQDQSIVGLATPAPAPMRFGVGLAEPLAAATVGVTQQQHQSISLARRAAAMASGW